MPARIDDRVDAAVIRIEDFRAPQACRFRVMPSLPGTVVTSLISGIELAAVAGGTTITSRRSCANQMRAKMSDEHLGDTGNADVPADVPNQFATRQAEIAE